MTSIAPEAIRTSPFEDSRARTCSSPAARPESDRRSRCGSPRTARTSRSTTCAQPEEAARPRSRCTPAWRRCSQEGVRDVLVGADVSDEDDVVRMVADAVERLGGIDVLVNNAGYPDLAPVARALERRLRQGARRQPARLVPLRARGDQALPRRGQAGLDRQHLERPPADPEAGLPRLLGLARAG